MSDNYVSFTHEVEQFFRHVMLRMTMKAKLLGFELRWTFDIITLVKNANS